MPTPRGNKITTSYTIDAALYAAVNRYFHQAELHSRSEAIERLLLAGMDHLGLPKPSVEATWARPLPEERNAAAPVASASPEAEASWEELDGSASGASSSESEAG